MIAKLDGVDESRRIQDLLEANNRYQQEGRNWRMIDELRAGAGHSVTICNNKPDFGRPGAKVTCVGDWTCWVDLDFYGDNIAAALGAAVVAFRQANASAAVRVNVEDPMKVPLYVMERANKIISPSGRLLKNRCGETDRADEFSGRPPEDNDGT